jgi:UDP-N-acetylglucosamine 4-epimerase
MSYELLKQRLKAEPKSWLVSGVAGFIGSNLLEALLSLDQKVFGMDNFFSGHRENLKEVRSRVTSEQWAHFSFKEGDIRDLPACHQACPGVDYVLHQAAMCSVPASIADPLAAHHINVSGTLNLMLAARDSKVKAFVYASSSAVYGDSPGPAKSENDLSNPISPYGANKYMNELYGQVFARCYSLKTMGLRYFNVFGPRQDPNGAYAAVIPKWISALIKDEPVIIYGDGETTRDFCYVANVVQANLLAAVASSPGEGNPVYNVALNKSTSLNELFAALQKVLSHDYPHVKGIRPIYKAFRPGDIRESQADISRAQKFLGYDPTVGVEEGLSLAIDWYKIRLARP